MKFEARGHSILATRMAGNSAKIETLREITGKSFEYPLISERLMGGAYLGGLEMEVQDPPSAKKLHLFQVDPMPVHRTSHLAKTINVAELGRMRGRSNLNELDLIPSASTLIRKGMHPLPESE